MTIVEPQEDRCPLGNPSVWVVVATEAKTCPCRRLVVLNDAFLTRSHAPIAGHVIEIDDHSQRKGSRQPPSRWIGLAERILGEWAPTLRASLLLGVLLAGLITLVIVGLGLGGALLITAAGTVLKIVQRQSKRSN